MKKIIDLLCLLLVSAVLLSACDKKDKEKIDQAVVEGIVAAGSMVKYEEAFKEANKDFPKEDGKWIKNISETQTRKISYRIVDNKFIVEFETVITGRGTYLARFELTFEGDGKVVMIPSRYESKKWNIKAEATKTYNTVDEAIANMPR